MSLNLVTPPVSEPITPDEVRDNSRIAAIDEDGYLQQLIKTARQVAETYTRRVFIESQWEYRCDAFPACELELPNAPLISVDSISYLDTAGDSQVLDPGDYEIDIYSHPGRVRPLTSWPGTIDRYNAVTITFTCGFGTALDVPKPIRQALLMLVDHWYEHRSDVTELRLENAPQGFESLLWPYRLLSF